ncbi:MAG: S53 family peptidase [Bryobacteraceae bacterium]
MFSRVPLSGSYRNHPADSIFVGVPPPDDVIQITLLLKRRNAAPPPDIIERHLSSAELAKLNGADPADIQAVEAFASQHHFCIAHIHPEARSVTLTGPLSTMSAAFGTDLALTHVDGKVLRTRQGSLYIPEALQDRIIAVLGFDERPAAGTRHRFQPRAPGAVSYTPPQVAQAYGFPMSTGAGQTIALIELGGGYRKSDLHSYWQQLALPNVLTSAVSIDGAHNRPTGDPNGPDGEVVLDIEIAGALAPGARIAVYFAPNTDQGFLNAINAAIHDQLRKPSIISISWGAPESQWTPQAMNAFNAAFHDAALLGISMCAAAGDSGSSDGEVDGNVHVDFPASSPWVLGCGGTTLVAHNGNIQSETVWNNGSNGGATGGGVSSHFSRPAYQKHVNVPRPIGTLSHIGRGVPDVAGVADPNTGYTILFDGIEGTIGGTSAVAPLWAGLIARCNEQLGKNLGWFHQILYGTLAEQKALNDITSGTNGAYRAAPGWDPCTGLGSPKGQAILNVLKQFHTK